MEKISVVIPCFNQVHLTKRCLESYLKNSSFKNQLYIIDNASSDDTFSYLESFKILAEQKGHKVFLIKNEENVGFGRAMNQGIRKSNADYVALLNNDTWLMPGWDRTFVEKIENLGADMLAPYCYERPFQENMEEISDKFLKRNKGKKRKKWVPILMFFRRSSLEKIGHFDEDYFVTYEDLDLKQRADRNNFRYFQVADCFIWHHSKGTRGKDEAPSRHEEEGLRIFMKKWGFDPRPMENTFIAKLKRSWIKRMNERGLF
jgi:GT2 family glycosyltransferase